MRQIVFFDLPTESPKQRKAYRDFRKFLINEGFLMLQYSVYSKIVLNGTQSTTVRRRIEFNKPDEGSVVILKVTEKQFAGMEYVLGEKNTSAANSNSRFIILGEEK